MVESTGELAITAGDSLDFAHLSGDFNPLHIDGRYARRLQFGRTVIHGVHHLLRVLDAIAVDTRLPSLDRLTRLKARFRNPAWENEPITYVATADTAAGIWALTSSCAGRVVLDLSLSFSESAGSSPPLDIPDEAFARESAEQQQFPPAQHYDPLPVAVSRRLANSLFPSLASAAPLPLRLGQILATTRIVGMRCPGLHSVYSALDLTFDPPQPDDAEVRYQVERSDPRVRLVRIGVSGAGLRGTLDTFFRPEPVRQPSYAEVRAQVDVQASAGRRALVIGGSRGIGEVTAKVLAARGASVCLTYNQGEEEASRVVSDIRAGGGQCESHRFDVGAISPDDPVFHGIDEVYFFASPHIDANRNTKWDESLFQRYCHCYVSGFGAVVHAIQAAVADDGEVRYFYPSTVYLSAPELGFAEYAAAKGAGEALCGQLAARYPKSRFDVPRLPRIATDQTASVIPIKCETALDVLLGHLRQHA